MNTLHSFGYASVLNDLPDAELVAAWDSDLDRLKKCCKQLNISKPCKSIDEILSMPLDAVIICSRNNTHLELAEKAAQSGKHILCEKPIATTIEDGQRMIDICKECGVKLMIAFPCRYIPQVGSGKRDFKGRQTRRNLCS